MSNDFPIRIGVLRGGPSAEHEVSMNSGSAIIQVIKDNFDYKYRPHDIFIDRKGSWFIDGRPISIHDLHSSVDLVFNALHGTYGEDGKVQSLLEWHGIPFTGSGSLASSLGMNKSLTKKILKDHGIKTPSWIEIKAEEIKENIKGIVSRLFRTFHLPAVVKPNSSGSSVGVTIVKYYNELPEALFKAIEHSDTVILEEYIKGVESTCGVLENFRSQDLYALPPIEIRPSAHFFDYDAKYSGKSEKIVPATFSDKLKREIEELSTKIHRALGLRHYSRSDFMIHPTRGIYALEVNTLPGLTMESLYPKSLRAVGSGLPEFVEHIVGLVM